MERGDLPQDDIAMLGWSGADSPLVSVEEILTCDDDWDDFGKVVYLHVCICVCV